MSNQHRKWRPSTAAKPSHLSLTAPSTSVTALRGANLAFASAVPASTGSSGQYVQHQQEKKTPEQTDDDPIQKTATSAAQRSPSRGRHMTTKDAQLLPARNNSTAPNPPVPVFNRASSMIAARLASANSSPIRGSRIQPSPTRGGPLARSISSSDVESGTGVSRTKSRSRSQRETTMPSLDMNKIPRLVKEQVADTSSRPGSVSEVATRIAISEGRLDEEEDTERSLTQDSHRDKPRPLSKPAPATPRKPSNKPALKPNLTGPSINDGPSRNEIVNRMADAMVASSLASSRPSSPAKRSKRLGALRRSSSAHELYKIPSIDQEPVPQVPRYLKQTLRKTVHEDGEEVVETRRGRRHLMRKHPNMHHEGDRKRWRDKVTETERKRYEGVFAANRGLLLKECEPNASPSRQVDPSAQGNQVANIIVRDIWERSRLSAPILERIYDLVAAEETNVLNREQFVVGLWLIDQQLKGRKLPVAVSDSVWASVRHSQGLKVRNVAR